MADRLPSYLPRIAALILVVLAATAGITYAAGSGVGSAPAVPTVTTPVPKPLVVPDVRNQAFVFAKGTLADAGFAWKVAGSVRGYAANVVVSQSPAAGALVVNDGAPLITLTLRRNSAYPQSGLAADTSPYQASAVRAADLAGNPIGPAAPATAAATPPAKAAKTAKAATPAKAPKPAATTTATTTATTATTTTTTTTATTATTPTTATTATTPAKATKAAASAKHGAANWPQTRPAAFVVPGARKEPLNEMPLTDRATALGTWLDAHKKMTAASAKYWLYQNDWVVAGAKFGWWRGAEALKTLIAVDRRTQTLWGIGSKSALAAQAALSAVQARTK
jgi:PASTA domain-containing protein